MKLRALLTLVMVLAVSAAFAQGGLVLNLYTGYSMTAFEDQDDAAGTLPLGVQLGKQFSEALEAGVEFNYPLGGYTFEVEDIFGKATTTFNFYNVGLYGKYYLTEKVYGKAGVAMYMGNATVEYELDDAFSDLMADEDLTEDVDFKSAIGFNVGAGIFLTPSIFVEFDYHINSREPDIEGMDGESSGFNFWNAKIGYQLGL